MEVILLSDVDKLGYRGQIVKVADGFGRNHLLPKKLAVAATPQNRKWAEQQRVKFLKLEASERGEAQELAQLMQDVSVAFKRKAGEQGTLFGSVTAMDIAEGLEAQGYRIDRRKVQLATPIKVVGEYAVPVKLHREVAVNVKVTVESDAPPPPAAPEAAAAPAAEPAAAPAPEAAAPQAEPEKSAEPSA
jgi:large subunit ribosomal protein L9